MNEIQIFQNDKFGQIRVVEKDGDGWFVAADVCKALDLGQVTNTIRRLDDDEKALISIKGINKGNDKVNIVNEYGLYNLVLASRKPEAKTFKRWITHEVLPSIRKNGKYELLPAACDDEQYLDVQKLEMDQRIRIAGIVASCRREHLPLVAKILSLDLDDLRIPSLTSEANSAAIEYIDSAWDSFETTIPIRVFHANYVNWCKENDIVPMTKNKLTAVLKKFYPIVTSMSSYSVNGKMVFRNVRVYRKTRKQLREGDAR